LKQRGVEARRPGMEKGKDGAKVRITTRSGYERKMEQRKRDSITARRRRRVESMENVESEFEGFND
jgi:ATP-dependent RNA helicase DDX52/ROK1